MKFRRRVNSTVVRKKERQCFVSLFMMNRAFALMLMIVSFGASGCNRIRSQATATSTEPASLDKPRRVRPASCPLTLPPSVPFTPPGEHEFGADEDWFWLGTEKLYTGPFKKRRKKGGGGVAGAPACVGARLC